MKEIKECKKEFKEVRGGNSDVKLGN